MMSSLYDGYIVVTTEGDPLNRNRVRVCCPELWGEGEENWSNWLDVAGTPLDQASLRVTQVFTGRVCRVKEFWWVIPI